MGYCSTADSSIEQAQTYVGLAMKELARIVIERADGWNEYSGEYRSKLNDALSLIGQARELIEGK